MNTTEKAAARLPWQPWLGEEEEVAADGEARIQVEAQRVLGVVVDDLEDERRKAMVAEHTAAVARAQQELAEQEVEQCIRWVEHEEARFEVWAQDLAAAAAATTQRAVDAAVASIRRREVSPERRRADTAEASVVDQARASRLRPCAGPIALD